MPVFAGASASRENGRHHGEPVVPGKRKSSLGERPKRTSGNAGTVLQAGSATGDRRAGQVLL